MSRRGHWLVVMLLMLLLCVAGALAAFRRDIVFHGAPAFFRAIERGDVFTVRIFVVAGFDPHGVWATPVLNPAAENGSLEMMAFLIAHGADINAHSKGGGDSPIKVAIRRQQLESVRFLLEHGASPNPSIRGEEPPLRVAASEAFRLLLQHGARLVDGSSEVEAASREEVSRGACSEILNLLQVVH